MATAPTLTKTGAKGKATTLDKGVFDVKVDNHELLKLAYDVNHAATRYNYAKTKTRSEVRGGGRKPWRQKGTGRARAGTIRSPLWRGGGITFGPLGIENYQKNLPKKARNLAVRQALSLKAQENAVEVISDIDIKDSKTKKAHILFEKIGLNRNVLVVALPEEQDRSLNNLPFVAVVTPQELNTKAILDANALLFTKSGLDITVKTFGGVG